MTKGLYRKVLKQIRLLFVHIYNPKYFPFFHLMYALVDRMIYIKDPYCNRKNLTMSNYTYSEKNHGLKHINASTINNNIILNVHSSSTTFTTYFQVYLFKFILLLHHGHNILHFVSLLLYFKLLCIDACLPMLQHLHIIQ